MGQPNRQLSPPNLDLRHIQDHFEFTFPRDVTTWFSGGCSLPVFEPSAGAGRFPSSAGNLLPRFQHGSKTWVRRLSLARSRNYILPTGVSDCTIAFRNCKSFLPKRSCRRTASFDTLQRQITIRNNQTKGFGFLDMVFTSATPGLCNRSKNSLIALCCCIGYLMPVLRLQNVNVTDSFARDSATKNVQRSSSG